MLFCVWAGAELRTCLSLTSRMEEVRGGGETYPSDKKRALHIGGGAGNTTYTAFSEGADWDASLSMVIVGGRRGIVLCLAA